MFWPHTRNFCYNDIVSFTGGGVGVGGGVMTFVVDCKQEKCSWVDDAPRNTLLVVLTTVVVDCKHVGSRFLWLAHTRIHVSPWLHTRGLALRSPQNFLNIQKDGSWLYE